MFFVVAYGYFRVRPCTVVIVIPSIITFMRPSALLLSVLDIIITTVVDGDMNGYHDDSSDGEEFCDTSDAPDNRVNYIR